MNRQRRLEAIARRRAFIDSQIQMLSNTEARVPNIIRNRTGRPLPSKAKPALYNPVEYLNQKQNVLHSSQFIQTTAHHAALNSSNHQASQQACVSQSFGIGQANSSTEDMYVAVLNDGGQGHATFKIEGDHANGGVPITLTEELAKMLSGGSQQFETIKTQDGTVMVVLEGNNFTEGETEAGGGTFSFGDAEVKSSEETLPVTPMPLPVDESETEEVRTEEESYEESYVIVQTPDGDVLVPSSKLCAQFPNQSVSSDESIVQFIATESGAIEKFITSSSPAESSNKRSPAINRRINYNNGTTKQNKPTPPGIQRIGPSFGSSTFKRPTSVKNVGAVIKKAPIKKNNALDHKLLHNIMQSHVVSESVVVPPKISTAEEKPRPFRFELPELEDDMNDLDNCFMMSVPVPIKIDSLRSETTRNKKDGMAKSLMNNLSSSNETVAPKTSENPTVETVEVVNKYPGGQITSNGNVSTNGTKDATSEMIIMAMCPQCNEEFNAEVPHFCQNQNWIEIPIDQSVEQDVSSFPEDHEEHCDTQLKNNNNVDTDVSSACSTSIVVANGSLTNENTVEENGVIKSVNTLNVSASSSTVPSGETQVDISSPSDSSDHLVSSIPLSGQIESPLIIVSSKDFISKNEDLLSFCVQLVDNDEQGPSKRAKLFNNNYTDNCLSSSEIIVDSSINQIETNLVATSAQESVNSESTDVGRRTLNKASARANMSNEVGNVEKWNSVTEDLDADQSDGNSNPVATIQSARIRSRNDRIKAMDKNETNEEELGFNFRNIFEQVAKQTYN